MHIKNATPKFYLDTGNGTDPKGTLGFNGTDNYLLAGAGKLILQSDNSTIQLNSPINFNYQTLTNIANGSIPWGAISGVTIACNQISDVGSLVPFSINGSNQEIHWSYPVTQDSTNIGGLLLSNTGTGGTTMELKGYANYNQPTQIPKLFVYRASIILQILGKQCLYLIITEISTTEDSFLRHLTA